MDREYDENYVAHYRLFREYVEHEDDLINHRSTWHHTLQGLLFTALGITLSKVDPTGNEHVASVQRALIVLLPVLDMLISLAAFLSIRAATQALNALREQWNTLAQLYGVEVWPTLPQLTGAGNAWAIRWGKSPAYSIPCAIGAAWFLVLLTARGHVPF